MRFAAILPNPTSRALGKVSVCFRFAGERSSVRRAQVFRFTEVRSGPMNFERVAGRFLAGSSLPTNISLLIFV